MEPVGVVTVPALDKYSTLAEALGKDLAPYIEQVHALPNVPARVLYRGVAIDVGEEAEAEPVGARGRVGEAVNHHVGLVGVEGLPHTVVKFIVRNGTPKWRLLVLDLHRCSI